MADEDKQTEDRLEEDMQSGILTALQTEDKQKSKKSAEKEADLDVQVAIHSSIDDTYTGQVVEIKDDYAKTRFRTTREMTYDHEGLIYNAFIYGAAAWAAQASINKEFLITAASKVNFLSPVKLGDTVDFEASAFFSESKKQEVKVIGFVNEIRVFEGSYSVLILEDHILRIQKYQVEKQAKESRELRAKMKAEQEG